MVHSDPKLSVIIHSRNLISRESSQGGQGSQFSYFPIVLPPSIDRKYTIPIDQLGDCLAIELFKEILFEITFQLLKQKQEHTEL